MDNFKAVVTLVNEQRGKPCPTIKLFLVIQPHVDRLVRHHLMLITNRRRKEEERKLSFG